jgi:hypothetical protein
MLKNQTVAIAISSALLALSRVDAAPAATPLTTVRVASKLTKPLRVTHAPGDFDRAFIVQPTDGPLIQELQAEKPPGTPVWIYRRPDPAAANRDRQPWRFIPTGHRE